MKKLFITGLIVMILSACQSNNSSEQANSTPGVHSVKVEEVLQTTQYTYLHVKEGDQEQWLALPKMNASVGETYYYKNGLPMTDFESKELNRTFSNVLFLDNISNTPEVAEKSTAASPSEQPANANSDAQQSNADPAAASSKEMHTVVAEEVLQTNQYTYIRAKEDKNEIWMAVSKMEPKVGKTYYFKGGLPMTDFVSKELKRTFNNILFVDNISTDAASLEKEAAPATDNADVAADQGSQTVSTGSAIPLEKKEIKMKHGKDEMTIASLYEKKKSFQGKTIKIKGQVTKYTPGIMKKNWIHLQDGTEFSGKFDLTVTTDEEVKVGDNITVEGVINLDKDFGFNYFYDVIMEDAKVTK